MKEYLADLVRGARDPVQATNLVREYFQARILGSLQRSGAMIPLAFHGGTALRFLYSLPRSSEDLDFTLERPQADYAFRDYLDRIRRMFEAESYQVRLRVQDQKTVHSAFVRFPGLPHELGLSGQAEQVLSVKLEVDTHPPAGAQLEVSLVRRHVLLRLQHHDQASLLAGKLHAILQRKFSKGRDYYDLIWYLGDRSWPPPNLVLLNNALAQTRWAGPSVTAANWKSLVAQRVESADFEALRQDVAPFIEQTAELELLSREVLHSLLS